MRNAIASDEVLRQGEAMLRDRSRGMTLRQIGDKHGCSYEAVRRRIEATLAHRAIPTVEEYREVVNDRLDDLDQRSELLLKRTLERLDEVTVPATAEGVGLAVDKVLAVSNLADRILARQLAISERRAKLNGLDRPVKVEVRHTVDTSEADEQTRARVAEAKARARAGS